MKLLLISSSTRKLNDIINILNEDITYLIVDKYETLDTFTRKLTDLNLAYQSIDDVALVFDNNGNRCPLFEFTTEEITDYENLKSQRNQEIQSISQSEEDEAVTTASLDIIHINSAFINSNEFFSSSLVSVIDYIKTLCSIEDVTIVTKDYLTSRDVKLNTKSFDVTNDNISKNLLGIRAVPLDGNIYTADDLYALMQSTTTEDMNRSYTLMNDIDMSGYESESIGKITYTFLGSFNGNGKNITINETLLNGYFGLFGSVNVITGPPPSPYPIVNIENLNVVYINNGFSITNNSQNIGGLSGLTSYANVQNCNITYTQNTTLTVNNTDNFCFIGGVFGNLRNSTVNNCNLIALDTFTIVCTIANSTQNSTSLIGGFAGAFLGVNLNNSYCNFSKDIVINSDITQLGGVLKGAYIGFVDINAINTAINNVNYDCKSNVSLTCNNINQSSSVTNFMGFFGITQNGSSISNININIMENYTITYTNNRYSSVIGGLSGSLAGRFSGPTPISISSMTNCILAAKNITIDYTKSNNEPFDTSGQTFNIGGLFGQSNNGDIDNCNLICDNLNFNVAQNGQSYMNNLRLGGLAAGCFNTNLLNSNIYVFDCAFGWMFFDNAEYTNDFIPA